MTQIVTPSDGKRIDPDLIEWDEVKTLWLHGGLFIPECPTPFSLWAIMKHDAQIEMLTGQDALPMRRAGVRLSKRYGVPFDDWSVASPSDVNPVETMVASIKAAAEDGDVVGAGRGGVSDHAFADGKTEAAFMEALALAVAEAAIRVTVQGHPTDETIEDVRSIIENERHRFRSLCDAAGRPRDMTP